MMIKPINIASPRFEADKSSKNKDGEYKDPLMRWPLRGAAFTNEIGEALRPLVGDYATLSWAPALLYIGADIYDKYKNDQTEYSPNSRRCLKQAIFQGMASIFLPLVAVKAGQNLFSLVGLCFGDKLTINGQEHVNKLAQDFVSNGKLHAYHGKNEECVKEFTDIVASNMGHSEKAFIRRFYVNNENSIKKYAKNTMESLINLRKALLESKNTEEHKVLFDMYKRALDGGQTSNVAIKSVLKKYLQKGSLKGKTIKTIGGFIALGMAIKPIDNFVENVLIGKIAGPAIDGKRH